MYPLLNYNLTSYDKPVLLVIHGLFGTLDNWYSHSQFWSQYYSVLSMDLRNHGRSFHDKKMNFKVLCADIIQLLESLSINEFSILGHSLGGKVTLYLSQHLPPSFAINKIFIIDIAARQYLPGHDTLFAALLSMDLKKIIKRQEAEYYMRNTISDSATRQFLLKNLVRNEDGIGFHWRCNLNVLYKNYHSLIGQVVLSKVINIPFYCIKGSLSHYVTDDDFVYYTNYYPHAKMICIANAGHWVHADQPIIFREKILSLLQEKN